jgi:hypothetical protein
MKTEHLRRRMETRRNRKSKSANEILAPLGVVQFQKNQPPEEPMQVVYAKSQNLRSRTKVVGSTVFEFNREGICRLEIRPGMGRALYDYQELLKLNGISEHGAENTPEVAAPKPAPAPLPPPKVEAKVEPPKPVEKDPEPEPKSEDKTEAKSDSSDDDEEKPKRRRGRRRGADADKEND